jgi:DNA primase
LFYGIHLAKGTIRETTVALVMEGYLDVIMAHQHGFQNAIATCGTAFTGGHVRTLSRLAREVVLVFDGDEAGRQAVDRALEQLCRADLVPRVLLMPQGHDPDSFLREKGREAFRTLVAEAPYFADYRLTAALKEFDPKTTDGRVRLVEAMVPTLGSIAQYLRRGEYIRSVAQRIGVDEEALRREVRIWMTQQRSGQQRKPSSAVPADTDTIAAPMPLDRGQVIACDLLRIMVSHAGFAALAREHLDISLLPEGAIRETFEEALRLMKEDGTIDASILLRKCGEDLITRTVSEGATSECLHGDARTCLEDYIRQLKRLSVEEECNRLLERIDMDKDDEERVTEDAENLRKLQESLRQRRTLSG